jgi:hypothetical protein
VLVSAQVPVTRDSGFRIASNSKVFTSMMLYQLRDLGKLPQGLDTPVAQIMPGWTEPAQPYGDAGAVSTRGLTLRALATHASGLPRETPSAGATEQAILEAIGDAHMLFPMYSSTAYSNLGVALLGRTLEKVTGGFTWEEVRSSPPTTISSHPDPSPGRSRRPLAPAVGRAQDHGPAQHERLWPVPAHRRRGRLHRRRSRPFHRTSAATPTLVVRRCTAADKPAFESVR